MQTLYTIVIVFLLPTLRKLTGIIKTTYFVGYSKTYIWNYIGCQDSPLRVALSLWSPSLHTGLRGPRESVISNTRSSNLFTRISLSWISSQSRHSFANLFPLSQQFDYPSYVICILSLRLLFLEISAREIRDFVKVS
jgi:hypothetical protein